MMIPPKDEDAAPSEIPPPGDEPGTDEEPGSGPPDAIASTRASRLWLRILPSLVILAIILVFVVQNHDDVRIRFITLSVTWPLSIALLASAALGAVLVLAIGSVRILQLRRQIHHRVPRRHGDRTA